MSNLKGQLALITGATAGIGAAIADLFAAQGCHLVLTGRREDRLQAQKARLEKEHGIEVLTLAFDLQDRAACEAAFQAHAARLKKVDILVNNAGLAKGVDPMPTAKLEDWDMMIDTNVKGLLYMTRLLLPAMVARRTGHIVNLGSVAGRWTYPGGGVYCATKFAVRALSEGLRMDLLGTNIRVSNIEPGMVETEFSEVRLGDKSKARKVYEGMKPLAARDIAESVLWCVQRPAHVNIQELVIFPVDQAGIGYVHRR